MLLAVVAWYEHANGNVVSQHVARLLKTVRLNTMAKGLKFRDEDFSEADASDSSGCPHISLGALGILQDFHTMFFATRCTDTKINFT